MAQSESSTESKKASSSPPLNEEEGAQLLAFARQTVEAFVRGLPLPKLARMPPSFEQPGAVFVTIHRLGQLRGCIGSFSWDLPLWQAVQQMAVFAASRDSRFDPVEVAELPELHFEISLLTPPVLLEQIDSLEIGQDGLLISRGMARGVLLPQVAVEHAWDRETFLAHTCMKAGLSADAWRKPGTRIERFRAYIFEECQP